jgi:hypothetical protein
MERKIKKNVDSTLAVDLDVEDADEDFGDADDFGDLDDDAELELLELACQ